MKKSLRNFGLEIEFSSELAKIDKILKKIIPKKNYLVDKSYCNSNGDNWHLKLDGTTQSELATPILNLDCKNITLLIKILDALKEGGIEISKKDSVHVHVDCGDVDQRILIASWLKQEKRIRALFPKHRRNNTYCESISELKRTKPIAQLFKNAETQTTSHHCDFSLKYYNIRGTAEYRLMEGSLSFIDIIGWVKVCLRFIDISRNLDPFECLLDTQQHDDGDYSFLNNKYLEIWCQQRRSNFI